MSMIDRYNIQVGQTWAAADGSRGLVRVIDTSTYRAQDDVVIQTQEGVKRIDAWKLAACRYYLVSEDLSTGKVNPTLDV